MAHSGAALAARSLPPASVLPPGSFSWLVLALFAAVVPLVSAPAPWLSSYPDSWVLPLIGWVNVATEAVVGVIKPLTRAISAGLEWPMIALRDLLQWLPWPVTVLGVALIAVHAAGRKLGALCLVILLYIAISGYWRQSLNTLALVGIAVPLSLLIGLGLGILAHRTAAGARVIPPILDVMQTLPTFAYLVPLLVMFGFGPVVGLIASAIYASPPMVRNVHLGLKLVATEIVEASRISGASALQQLFWVELPAALAQIKVGINQTIMAALSMVIIASVIGGFDDIGWEVLSTMRKARFGESLMSGLVIVLIAVVLDRISGAYAGRRASSAARRGGRSAWIWACAALALLGVAIKLSGAAPVPDAPGWMKATTMWLDDRLEGVVRALGDWLTSLKNGFFFYYLLPLRIGLSKAILPVTWGFEFTDAMRWGYLVFSAAFSAAALRRFGWRSGLALAVLLYLLYFGLVGISWAVFFCAVTLLAYQVGGSRLALLCAGSMGFILLAGMWERAMLSLYLCGAAVAMSFMLGASIGVWAAASDRVSAVVRPILDTFQTIPLFVFLIPVLMFFQIGEFTALLAIVAYAFVPAARYTENGLRQVSPQMIEVATEQGCTPRQILLQVKIPLAIPSIMVGLNQTVLYAFAMLVIAALVGTTGLGQQIYLALGNADIGLGLVAGFSMALLAIIIDRMIQTWSASRFAALRTD